MDVSLILKVAGVGVLVFVAHLVLKNAGREDQGILVTIAGIVVVLVMLVGEISKLLNAVKSVFGF